MSYGMFHIIGIKMRYGHFIGFPEVVFVIRFNYELMVLDHCISCILIIVH